MKKILSALLCFFILLGTTACLPFQKSQALYIEYDDIISEYTALLSAKKNGEELPALNTDDMDDQDRAIAEVLRGIVNNCKNVEAVERLGYGYKDFDGNGTKELVLLNKYTSIQAIFTISNERPILLESNYKAGNSFVFATKSRFFMVRSTVNDNIEETTFYTCRVSGDKMAYDAIYGKVYDCDKKETLEIFEITDGNRTPINEDTFNELYREYKKATLPDYTTTVKLLAPRIFFPLKDDVTNENLPVADFSSYAAIRETYNKISTCLDKFESQKWHSGEYDNLFTFPNEHSFEYYTRLLYAAYHGNYIEGYDEIDLNGDGQDELVLMNEDYSIKAIFTQKNGVPVMVECLSGGVGWLDDQGFIHIDREDYYELEYSVYEFTKSGDYSLVYSILLAENGNRYLTKNGKTEQITFEKSLEIFYDDYNRYPEYFDPNEQTRNVSKLTYTPLTPTTEEERIQAAKDITWYKYAHLERTTGKDLAHSNTYVTFENVTDTQMDVNFRYAFTFYYPDPNKDNFLLDDTTETFLRVTARAENGVFAFDENGVKGRIEFGQKHLWIIIEESTDERFPVGYHCYAEYTPQTDLLL